MIDSRYDEDLSENLFYQNLKSEYKDLLDEATHNNWIICIPRADSFQRSSLTQDDYLTHILVPNDELPETHYRTLSEKQVNVRNKVITVENDDIASSTCSHIIFEEIFYNENFSKYKVWCIECPLNRTSFKYDQKNGCFNPVSTLRDCIDLLWTESLGKGILEQLGLIIEDFLTKNTQLENCSLQTLKDLSSILYAKCLQTTIQDKRLRERTTKSKHLLENIKISVDSYMQHKIYKNLFSCISVCTSIEDSTFNKIVRNLYDIQLRDLNINKDLIDKIPCAKRELAKINGYSTILGKLNCLRNTFNEISKNNQTETQQNFISTDVLLSVTVFLVLKTNIANWIANLIFLKQFQFSTSREESNYLITTLEAAIEHIKSGSLTGSIDPECQDTENSDNEFEQNLAADNNHIDKVDFTNNNNNVNSFFEQIRFGHYETVNKILEKTIKTVKTAKIDAKNLCHPLCSCDKCERLLTQNFCDTIPTVFSCDDRGFTALHIACIFGQPKIVELLIEYKANIQSCDYSGASPLHYAAMKGHQNALLLLLHSGADINAIDSEKNTTLHFCCNNGHEPCVKAMLYFSEHQANEININCSNALGNTPLHNAARWGYENIVQILLEYGANTNIENKQKKTPLNYAHNLNIYQIMLKAKRRNKLNEIKPIVLTNKIITNICSDLSETVSNFDFNESNLSAGVKPSSTKEMKKVEKLLRSIAHGDLPLICYYLGIKSPDNHIDEPQSQMNTSQMCHPLCACATCKSQEIVIEELYHETQDINVCNVEGFTSLHVACLHGKTEIARILIQNGANLNLVTKKGLTALHLACQTQRNQIVRILARNKDCNINLQDTRGNTALHYACYANDQRIAEILVKNGADINLKNCAGISAFTEAENKLMFGLVKILHGDIKFEF